MAKVIKYQAWISSGFYSGLQKLSIPAFGVISTMILTHKALEKSEMGVWSLFLVITAFVEMMRETLVKTSLIKYLNQHKKEEETNILSAAFFLNSLITVLLALVLLFGAGAIERLLVAPGLKQMLWIFIPGLLVLIFFSHLTWIMYARSNFKGVFWAFFCRQGLSVLLIAASYLLYKRVTLNLLVFFYCGGIIAGTLIAYYYLRGTLRHAFSLSMKWVSTLWHFGKYVFATGLSSLVFRNADQMMLSPILGTTVYTANQNVSTRIINLADIPSQVLGDILFLKSLGKHNIEDRKIIKYYYEKAVGSILSVIVPIIAFIIIFPKFIILIIAGKQYLDAIPYLQLIAVSGIFLAFLKQYGVIIDSTGRPFINFLTTTLLAVIHIIFCYVLIHQWHFLGAAYALLCSHIVIFFLTQGLLYRYFGINFLNCFKNAISFYPEMLQMVLDKLKR